MSKAIWGLAPTERAALLLIAQGVRPPEAARRLGCARDTVHGYLAKARAKLGAATTDEAVERYRAWLREELAAFEA